MKILLLPTFVFFIAAASANIAPGGAGSGVLSTDKTSYATGTFSKDLVEPQPEVLNTSPNPVPELNRSGQLVDEAATLGTDPNVKRQAQEEKQLEEVKKIKKARPLPTPDFEGPGIKYR